MKKNEAIWSEKQEHFLDEAVFEISEQRIGSAKQCIQQALILKRCTAPTPKWKSFFDKMINGEDLTVDNFNKDMDTIFRTLSERAEAVRRSSASAGGPPVMASPILIPKSTSTSQHYISASAPAMAKDFSGMSIGSPPPTNRHTAQLVLPGIAEHHSGTPAVTPHPRGDFQGPGRHRSTSSTHQGTANIADSRFVVQRSVFFCLGRVIAVHWPENYGLTPAQNSTASEWSRTSGDGIHYKLRRMVVIKSGHGFSLVVPVSTYEGRGLKKYVSNQQDVRAHSIIYMSGSKPSLLSGEPGPDKQDIEVAPASLDQKLDIASRINFSKVHTIE